MAANEFQRIEAAYRDKEDLILVGAYQKGSDPSVDTALEVRPNALAFLQQTPDEATSLSDTRERLIGINGKIPKLPVKRS